MTLNNMLTVEKLLKMKPGIFDKGIVLDFRLYKDPVRWIAVRGGGVHDWTIYYHLKSKDYAYVSRHGDKCFTKEIIRELVHCNDEAFGFYRF